MAGSPKLKRRNDRNENVQYQSGWPDGCGYEPEQRHHGDVAGRTGVTDAGIKEGDDADGEEKENEIHIALEVVEALVPSACLLDSALDTSAATTFPLSASGAKVSGETEQYRR